MEFLPFRYYVREKETSNVKFEIIAVTPHKFQIRLPEYDYIKACPGMYVEYNRDQTLLFLLAYDKNQCLEFIKKLYMRMGSPDEYIEKLCNNPAFAKCKI